MTNDINNRFDHHPPKDDATVVKHQEFREATKALAAFYEEFLPESREKALALTNLEQTLMWANAAIARN